MSALLLTNMKIMKCLIFCFGLAVAQQQPDRSKYAANKTTDISSINDLAYKSPLMLDPKIRRALLTVLNRLEEQDNKKASVADSSKFSKKENTGNSYYFASSTSTVTPPKVGDIRWESTYKAYDPNAFKKYDYRNINVVTSRSVSNKPSKDNKNVNGVGVDSSERGGALFFQTPEKSAGNPTLKIHSALSVLSPSTASPKYALPGGDILFANLQNEINEQHLVEPTATATSTLTSTAGSSRTSSNNTTTDEAKKSATISSEEEEGVEFFEAPLLTAFTLEQDERGLPRRIIPLPVPEAEAQAILRNRINQQHDSLENRRARDQQKDIAAAGEVAASASASASASSHFRKPDLQAQENAVPLTPFLRLDLESQYQQLLERKRQIEVEKERLLADQEKTRRLKLALEWQQKQQEYARALNQNEIVQSEISFQKSVEPQVRMFVPIPPVVPTPPLQAFNLGLFPWQQQQPAQHNFQLSRNVLPPQQYVNFPQHIVDNQLQNLFQLSGLNPQGQQEDLNIVSKVLALNHEPNEVSRLAPQRVESPRNETVNLSNDVRTDERVNGPSVGGERSSASAGISPPSTNFGSGRPDFVF